MRHASLFSGIGGFDYAAEQMGWENVFNCEIDKFCQKVLKYHFPDAVQFGDIKQLKFKRDEQGNVWVRRDGIVENPMQSGRIQREPIEEGAEIREQRDIGSGDKIGIHIQEEEAWLNLGAVDIITGGFPCQPFSMAGKRRGTDDDRHLWPEMLRTIREIKPTWVVGENVFGFTNWNGGLVFHEVLSDLENEGYEVQPYIIPACGVNAPHRRDRVWIVAHAKECDARRIGGNGIEGWKILQKNRERFRPEFINRCQDGPAADTRNEGCEGVQFGRAFGIWESCVSATKLHQITDWSDFPTQPPIRSGDDEFSNDMDRYWDIIKYYYATIKETYGIKDLRNLRETIQQEAFWESFRGLHEIFKPEILLKVVQSFENAPEWHQGMELQNPSEVFEGVLRGMQKHYKSSDSSHRRKLEEQLGEQFNDLMRIMPYEVALAYMEIQSKYKAFSSRRRTESIKAAGNAIVPQVAFEIFKAIQKYEDDD
jgi:DNA (cytosine-5)-methyltransferase 1